MKNIKYLLYSLLLFTFVSNVNALTMKDTEIPAESWLVGTHLFTSEVENESGYTGAITTPFVMYAASSIESDSLNEMIIYYKIDDGYWYDYLDPDYNIIERDPSDEYLITHKNGVCVDPSCDFTGTYDYTITFNENENELKSIKVHHDKKISLEDIYTFEERIGYEMLCWYDVDAHGLSGEVFTEDMCFDFNTKITKDYNLNVMWSVNNYNVKYDLNGGILNEEDATGDDFDEVKTNLLVGQTCYINSDNNKALACNFVKTDKLVKTGYEFVGWSLNKDGEQYFEPGSEMRYLGTEENVTLYAVWKPIEYQITYDFAGGNFNDDLPLSKAEYGYEITENDLVKPLRKYHIFDGWYYYDGDMNSANDVKVKASDIITKNVKLVAKWNVANYKVNLYDGDSLISSIDMVYGKDNVGLTDFNNSAYALDGRIHVGYALSKDADKHYEIGHKSTNICEFNAKFNDDGTYYCDLYIVWKIEEKTVTYDLNGGHIDGDLSLNKVQYGYKFTADDLVVPKKEFYKFDGWYYTDDDTTTIDEKVNVGDTITTDVKLIAKWDVADYKVNYYIADEFVTSSDMVYGENAVGLMNFNDSAYALEGRIHVGWALTKDSEKIYDVGATSTNICEYNAKFNSDGTFYCDLYAVWKIEEKTVTYDLNGGYLNTNLSLNKVQYGYKLTADDLVAPKKDFYKFDGWYYTDDEATNDKKANIGDTIKTDVKLIAKWVAANYKVNYYINGEAAGVQTGCQYSGVNDNNTCTLDAYNGSMIPTSSRLIGWALTDSSGLFYDINATSKNICEYNAKFNDDGTYECNLYGVLTDIFAINYDLDGGEWTDENTVPTSIAIGESVFVNQIPVKDGYIFRNWIVNHDDVILDENVDKTVTIFLKNGTDFTLDAVWAEAINVTLDLNGGEAYPGIDFSEKIVLGKGDVLNFPLATKSGYILSGWDVYSIDYSFKGNQVYFDALNVDKGDYYTGVSSEGLPVSNQLCDKNDGCVYYAVSSDSTYDINKEDAVIDLSQAPYKINLVSNNKSLYLDEDFVLIESVSSDKYNVNFGDLKFVAKWDEVEQYKINYLHYGNDVTGDLADFPTSFSPGAGTITIPEMSKLPSKMQHSDLCVVYDYGLLESSECYSYNSDGDSFTISVLEMNYVIELTPSLDLPETSTG